MVCRYNILMMLYSGTDASYRHNILKRGPQPASCLCIGPAVTMPTHATAFQWPV